MFSVVQSTPETSRALLRETVFENRAVIPSDTAAYGKNTFCLEEGYANMFEIVFERDCLYKMERRKKFFYFRNEISREPVKNKKKKKEISSNETGIGESVDNLVSYRWNTIELPVASGDDNCRRVGN